MFSARSAASLCALGIITLFAALPAGAQGFQQIREGFTLSGGLGAGEASVHCSVCTSGAGISAYARLGTALHPDLIIGGEVSTWRRAGAVVTDSPYDVRVSLSTVTMIAQWYPHSDGGFFVEPGLGLGLLDTRTISQARGAEYRTGVSAGYQLGVGFDYRFKRNVSLTPYATLFGTAPSHTWERAESVHGYALQIGLGLTQH